MTKPALVSWLFVVALVACGSSPLVVAADPTPAATSGMYFARLWAEDAKRDRVFELGSAAETNERFSLTIGEIICVVVPGQHLLTVKPTLGGKEPGVGATVQEVQTGLQWSCKLRAVQPDGTFRAELIWSWDAVTSRKEHGVDRRTRNQTAVFTGKLGVATLIGIVSAPHEPLWQVYLKVDRPSATP